MSDAKYTKGPWIAYTDVKEPVINSLGAAYEPQIALVSDIEAESEANAHLIAAAPEMYEAIEQTLVEIEFFGGDLHNKLNSVSLLREILAKARGEE